MSARLAFDEASRAFDGVTVLERLTLLLEPGSFTVVVGASGSGKTTLLHIAAGLDTGYSGRFQLDPPNATLAYMFQQPRLLPWMTALENVTLVLRARGLAAVQARSQAMEALERVGLAASAQSYPQVLSGGMQQRVALARALAIDPDFLLMDEPFSALDEITADHLRAELLSLWAERPRTVLMVTHNIREACQMADRIIVLGHRPGRVMADIMVDLPRPRLLTDPALEALAQGVLQAVQPQTANSTVT
jgi:NitT/TauT family transport system ATP-binding protein